MTQSVHTTIQPKLLHRDRRRVGYKELRRNDQKFFRKGLSGKYDIGFLQLYLGQYFWLSAQSHAQKCRQSRVAYSEDDEALQFRYSQIHSKDPKSPAHSSFYARQ